MRQYTWLNSLPGGELAKTGLTRRQMIGEEEYQRLLPEVGPLAYLLTAIQAVGICDESVGMDRVIYKPTLWSEIMHWPGVQRLLQCEVEVMRRLSATCAEARNTAQTAEQPWEPS